MVTNELGQVSVTGPDEVRCVVLGCVVNNNHLKRTRAFGSLAENVVQTPLNRRDAIISGDDDRWGRPRHTAAALLLNGTLRRKSDALSVPNGIDDIGNEETLTH